MVHPVLEAIAIGDAFGLSYEGISSKDRSWRQRRKLRWGFLGPWGMTSDDTQQAHMALRALRKSEGYPRVFGRILLEYFSYWIALLPPGIGFATLKACLKMIVGLDPSQTGVRSGGNGPLPRAIIIGWEIADPRLMEEYVRVSTELTHKGEQSFVASLALAKIAQAMRVNPKLTNKDILCLCLNNDFPEWSLVLEAISSSKSLEQLLKKTNQTKGMGGYSYHTFAAALWVFLNRKHTRGMVELIRAGGDTDSAAAIFGGLCATRGEPLSTYWRERKILDFPLEAEPSFRRLGFNILSTLAIFLYHIPKRVCDALRS